MADFLTALAGGPPVTDNSQQDTNQDQVDDTTDDSAPPEDGAADDSSADDSDDSSASDADDADPAESESDEASDSAEDSAEDKRSRGDGRTMPAELKALIKANPTAAKLLKDLYFTNHAYSKFGKTAEVQKLKDYVDAYGSMDDAVRVKEAVDGMGGVQGLEDLRTGYDQYEKLDVKFTSGDPAYVDTIAKANPEAFAKIAPSFLQRFGVDHPEQYNYLMSQVVLNTLIGNGTMNQLSLAKQALASGNSAQAGEALKQIEQALNGIQSLSQQAPAMRQADPRQNELEQQRQALATERQQMFVKDVQTQTESWIAPEITKNLTAYVKGRAVNAARLSSAVKEEVGRLLQGNQSFVRARDAALKRGDRDGVVRTFKQFSTPLIAQAARAVAKDFGLSAAKKTQAQQQAQQQRQPGVKVEAGWEEVQKVPVRSDVDLEATTDDMIFDNKAVLKTGRKVFWRI